jgi:hypothetical protein
MTTTDPAERQQLLSQAALNASETVRRQTYLAAMQTPPLLTVEQQAELRRQCELAARQLQVLGVAILRAWVPVVEATIAAVTEFHRQLVEAGLVVDVEPTEDVAARALHRRRHRNTGPQQQHRAPRRIDPRGCQ